jgi:hypothetical protein
MDAEEKTIRSSLPGILFARRLFPRQQQGVRAVARRPAPACLLRAKVELHWGGL